MTNIVFQHISTLSFQSVLNFVRFSFQRYFSVESKIPILVVGNKADMTAVRQDYILQPEAFCAKHRVGLS